MGKIVDLTFRLKDQVSGKMGKISQALAKSNRQWQRAGKDIQNTGRSITKVGATLTTGITLPLAAAGTMAVTKFAEVDKTMTLVASTMGEAKYATADLDKAMKEAAANSTFGMNDAAQAALNFARGGWDAEQAANALAPAMNLAAGEGGDLDTVSAGLMATMNSFKANANEAAHYTDVFAAACNNSALDVNQLSSAMSVAAPIFEANGSSVEDAAKAMGIMANAGIDASVAANALKTGIARLADPAKSGAAAMERLGINAYDSEGKLKDITVLQGELSQAFSTLSGEEQSAAAAAIFGKNQMAPWLALIQSSTDSVGKLSDSIDNCNGVTNKMASDMMSGFGGSLEKLKSSIDVLATSFGQSLAPYVKKVADVLQNVTDKFNSLSDKQRDMVTRIALVVAAIGPALLVFGKMTTGIGGVVRTIGRLGQAIQKAGSLMALLSSPGAIVVGVLAAIAVAAVLIYKNWDKIAPVVKKVGKFFQNTAQSMGLSSENIKKRLEPVKDASQKLLVKIQQFGKTVQPVLEKVGKIAAKVFGVMFATALGRLMGTFNSIVKSITEYVSNITLALGGVIDFLTGVFTGDWDKALNGIKNIFKGVFGSLITLAKAPIDAIFGAISGAMSGIASLGDGVPGWIQNVVASIQNLWGIVSPVLSSLGDLAARVFSGIITTAIDVCVTGFRVFGQSVGTVIDGVKTALNGVITFVTGVFTGNWRQAWNGVKSIFSGVWTSLISIAKGPLNTITSMVNRVISSLNSIKIPDWVPGVGGKGISIPKIPALASGTQDWQGGIVQVSEKGGEIIDLPKGSRVYPHDKTVEMAYNDGVRNGNKNINININIPGVVVRSQSDIDLMTAQIVNKARLAFANAG